MMLDATLIGDTWELRAGRVLYATVDRTLTRKRIVWASDTGDERADAYHDREVSDAVDDFATRVAPSAAVHTAATLDNGRAVPVVCVARWDARALDSFGIQAWPPAAGPREVRDRLRAAILNSGYEWPDGAVTVRLRGTPAAHKMTRPAGFDLPTAVGILAASGQVPAEVLERPYHGELGLSGAVIAGDGTHVGTLRSVLEAVAS